MGDEIKVKVMLIDDQGRIKLSRKAAMQELGETDPEPVNVGGGDDRGGDQGRRDSGPPRETTAAPAEAAAVIAIVVHDEIKKRLAAALARRVVKPYNHTTPHECGR